MKILHYFLGFPPYRTGGLTKYVTDLMKAQVADGHTVMALWPGQIGVVNKKINMKKRSSVDGIENYEVINPLPVSLDEGISDFDAYMQSCDKNVYGNYLKKAAPDVIHIHTLMGLHKEFIETAKHLGIHTVFTTHDYFGICPKVTLYRYGVPCENDHDCRNCIACNYNSLSLGKIKILQSPIYRILKNSVIVKQLRKQHRGEFFANEMIPEIGDVDIASTAKEYRRLRLYYIEMLQNVDLIHFNSSVTESVYRKYLTPKTSKLMTITHQNIADNRRTNTWTPGDKLRIAYLAPAKPFKGFNVLKDALDDIWKSGKQDFELKVFSPVQNPSPYMKIQEDGFAYDQLENILANADVLVAPSIWYETFGFTVLEAISYGVPVIVSNHVGAQDIVGSCGIVVEAGSVESLKQAVLELNVHKQREIRENITKSAKIKTWREFLDENYTLYEKQR